MICNGSHNFWNMPIFNLNMNIMVICRELNIYYKQMKMGAKNVVIKRDGDLEI